MAQADRGERGAVRDPEHRDGAGGEVPLLRGLGGELPDPEDLHGGARAGERDERERLGQCGHQHQREVLYPSFPHYKATDQNMFRSTLRPHNHEMDRSSNSTGTGV